MATTVRVPVHLLNARYTTLAGNTFWTPAALTAWDGGHWELAKDVDGKVYGTVGVPMSLAGTPNAKLVLAVAANATSGVTRLSAATKAVSDGGSLNPSSLTGETARDITVPGTAYLRTDVTLPVSGSLAVTVAAGDLLIIEITHEGAHANDTLAVNTLLFGAWLQCDVS